VQESIVNTVNKWQQVQAKKDNSLKDLIAQRYPSRIFTIDLLNNLMFSGDKNTIKNSIGSIQDLLHLRKV
jgi:hypothetical protein